MWCSWCAANRHLDSCETCQQRLTQLAAEPVWWLDASRCLEPTTPDVDPCLDDLAGDELDEFAFGFPTAIRLHDGSFLATHWCLEDGICGIRWVKLHVEFD